MKPPLPTWPFLKAPKAPPPRPAAWSPTSPNSSYGEDFLSWSTDPVRKAGETGLVKTENGWYVTYYVSSGDPIWKQTTTAALQQQDFDKLAGDASEGWIVSTGMGMNFVKA